MNTETKPSATVHFNVGGSLYEVSRSLLERHSDTMLARLVSDEWQDENNKQENKPIFIERNGIRFQYVLDFMRDGSVCLPAKGVSKQAFLTDLAYLGFTNIDQHNTVSVDCVTGDSIKHLKSLEEEYVFSKQQLEDLVKENEEEKEAKLKALQDELESQKQALLEEFAEKKRLAAETHDMKQLELKHRQGCLEVAHFFFKRFQEGKSLELRLGPTDHNELSYTENVCRFYNWVIPMEDSNAEKVVGDRVLQECLGKFGLEPDTCSVEKPELPWGWKRMEDEPSGHSYYFNEDTGETSWDPPMNEEEELILVVREKTVSG